MNAKLLMIIGVCCFLTACAKVSPVRETSTHGAYVALAEAANSTSVSLTSLGATEQAAYPPASISEPPDPATYGMANIASLTWNGPIFPLVRQIADATHYKLRVLGNKPAIPVLVSIDAKNMMLGDILRDAGYQCKNRAKVIVFPSTKTIELRYASS